MRSRKRHSGGKIESLALEEKVPFGKARGVREGEGESDSIQMGGAS